MTETDVKDRIKFAAHDLVMQYSIRSVSMDDIASSLGMSKKTIYQYYKDKDELIDAVVEGVLQNTQLACNTDRAKADNAVHEVILSMDMIAQMFRKMNPSILFDMQKYHPEAFQRFLKHKNDFIYNILRQNLERGIKEALYRPEINIDILARFRVDSMFIPFTPEFQRNMKYNLLEIEQQIITNFLFGLVTLKGYKLVVKYMQLRQHGGKITNGNNGIKKTQ
ncbi:MAG TPA: TetR/AcrR family transcriptional regulator [Ferruginibacter sp.]|nr:TetR/AcrR family transcriptional regulator [Ferruginibacter sp.]